MTADNHQSIERHFCVDTYVNRGLTLVKGQGVYLYDSSGDRYLDLMSNYGVNIFGYRHPDITRALAEQLEKLTTLHGSFNNDVRAVAAKALVRRCAAGLSRVFFSNSGSEAIEAALKFAVLATQKKRFVAAVHGYHGKTLGSLSATDGQKYRQAFAPLLWEFETVEFGNSQALEEVLSSQVAAVILEPIQGEAGIYPPSPGYLKKVRQLCDRHGAILIVDEVQTGCGRTGPFLASQSEEISYDIVCLGKGLAGGMPVGATLVNDKVANSIPKHIHTSTLGGNPLACAGILSTLNILDKTLRAHVEEVGSYFIDQLTLIKSKHIVAVRGKGLMIGLEVKENRDQLLKSLQRHHILAIPAGDKVVRFLPPFLVQKKHVDLLVTALKQILRD
ncbi:MAG: aspartate aminotransferase family protein [Candidatus Pacebacteria bacterium CG10_big_fil_rev_8_21_14_0_10_56_10]|nr:MAG: aspartate aminotransferase family protein [Candidatus Pacebacteria bacterium CG10_big_fil_rev_8_21_14_0_10_56_10]